MQQYHHQMQAMTTMKLVTMHSRQRLVHGFLAFFHLYVSLSLGLDHLLLTTLQPRHYIRYYMSF